MTEDIHMLLGSYVLGGLSADDRHAFDEHLDGCSRCRAELAEAAPLPALLRKVPGVPGTESIPGTAGIPGAAGIPGTTRQTGVQGAWIGPAVVDPSLTRLLVAARASRKRQYATRWVAVAAATAIAFGGGATAVAFTQRHGSRSARWITYDQTVAMKPSVGQNTVGVVGLTKKEWGTAIWVRLGHMPRTGPFTLWATDDQGHTQLAATWGETANGVCDLDGATSIPTAHLSSVSVLGPNNSMVADAPLNAATNR